MSESSEEKRCPTCGSAIPAGATQGLCPRCILQDVAGETDANTDATRTAVRPGLEPPTLEEIATAFPQFEVIELIGSGGMGAVFKVRQPRLDRLVALKVLPRALAGNAHFTERFTREAQALAKLNHPNIVAVHDFGESGGFHYLLMEFVDGANLRQAMRAGRFTPEQAFGVVPEICGALQYAHDEGVLHRDIKPENLLLDTKGRVKIVDFGIAKLIGLDDDTSPAAAALTGSMAPGTPQYMAPEQIEHPADVDHRADIYSLGVVFYEMLTGELPIGRFAAPSEKARVGGDVDDIVFRTLEKEPDRRQQSAGEVRTQVEGIADVPPPPFSRTPAGAGDSIHSGHHASGPTEKSRRAGRAVLMLVASAVVFFVVWGLVFLFVERQAAVERERQDAKSAEIDLLNQQARLYEKRRMEGKKNGLPADAIAILEDDVEKARGELYRALDSVREERITPTERDHLMAAMIGFIVVCVVVAVAALIATIRGWKVLRALRVSGQRRGRGSALFAALLVPVLAISALIVVIMVLPSHGMWTGPAISLAVIGSLVVNIWLVMRTWRWLNTPPTASEQAALRQSASMADSFAEGSAGRRRTGWGAWLIGLLVGVPVLFIGSCVAYLALSHEASSQARRLAAEKHADAAAAAAVAQAQAQALAEAEAIGSDLTSEERKIVGSWHFDQKLDVGDFHFSADRKWRMETADGKLKMSGTWKIVDGVLEKEVVDSTEGEQVGVLIRSDIIELIDEEMLVIKSRERDDELTLYSTHAMGDLEDRLLGAWRPPVSEQEELILFVSDRTFRFITSKAGTLIGTWRISGDDERLNLFVRDAPAGVESDINFGADFAKVSRNRLEFETPLYGNETVLEKLVAVDLSSEAQKLLGTWDFLDRGERGKCIFYADGSYRSEAVGQWDQATWRLDGEHLELTVTASSHAARVGQVERVEIVEEFNGERMVLRDEGAESTIEMRPFHPLSDSEQNLVGNWRALDVEPEENFEFWADRRFKVTTAGNVDEGYWRFYGGGQFEMVIEATDKQIHRGVALRGTVLKLDGRQFEFEKSVGGGTKALVRTSSAKRPADETPSVQNAETARPLSAADELSADELRLVGTWQLQLMVEGQSVGVPPDRVGRWELRVDRTWQMDEGSAAVSGDNWRVADGKLELIKSADDLGGEARHLKFVIEAIEPMRMTLLFPVGGPAQVFLRVLENDD